MKIIISSVVISLLLLAQGLFAEEDNRAVAFVNDDVITLYELNSRIEELTGKKSEELKGSTEQDFFKIREQILDIIIEERIVKSKIKELEDLQATTEQIDEYVEYIKEENKLTQEELVEQLKHEGLSLEKFREKVKEDLERRNLVDNEIRLKMIVTEEQIAAYYEANKKNYERPGSAHIASIFLVPASQGSASELDELKKKGETIIERISKGEKFEDLAKEFSNGPGANDGGDLGNIPLTDIDKKILDVINSLKDGEVSNPINMGNRIQIVKLIKKVDTGYAPIEELRDKIHETLYNNEMERRYKEYMNTLKKESYIKKIL
ncbi:MAG: peptidyl-prolyl cis-trans isomerase [Deltaproteobacteria bacterium]|nr:peptidyl-prolyl cis-trans isomerase [Deltaproteobacteria bacterium]